MVCISESLYVYYFNAHYIATGSNDIYQDANNNLGSLVVDFFRVCLSECSELCNFLQHVLTVFTMRKTFESNLLKTQKTSC